LKEYELENRLRLLYALQQIDLNLDEVQETKGDLPRIVAELDARLKEKERLKTEAENLVQHYLVSRDQTDLEIVSLKEKIEKYKAQQFEVKTNKQYDALAREVDYAHGQIVQLEKELESLEGKAGIGKADSERLAVEIEALRAELAEKQQELELVNKEHEEEELQLKHEREKIVVRLSKTDLRLYERVRNAKGGKAVVPVRRNACGGCFNRVPPQRVLELRKNDAIMICEHCSRILVSDEIVETYNLALQQ
jgi:predicted  nucleic acid-binding Zn-ribbon protein